MTTDFHSINPAPETILINGKKIPVRGISMEGFGMLIPRFPNLLPEFQARLERDKRITVQTIAEVAGSAMGAILAAGIGFPGNEEAEESLGQLAAPQQAKLLGKIVDLTMPDGLGPFVAEWGAVLEKVAKTPEPTPQRLRRFKVLRRESKPSSPSVDTTPAMSGA